MQKVRDAELSLQITEHEARNMKPETDKFAKFLICKITNPIGNFVNSQFRNFVPAFRFSLFATALAFATLLAAPVLAIETGLEETARQAELIPASGAALTLPQIIGKIIAVGIGLVGVIFLILMVYGGFLWMTARGDEAKVEKSKELITAAVIGLVIVLAAYIITNFVVTNLLSATTD